MHGTLARKPIVERVKRRCVTRSNDNKPASTIDHAVASALIPAAPTNVIGRPLDKAVIEAQSAWLKRKIAAARRASGNLSSEDVLITPELARVILDECNIGNRGISAKHVARIADDMASGKWRHTAQGISISNTGELNDGQHRLLAVLRSKTACMMRVTFGEDRDVFSVLDIGRMRRGGDALFVAGFKNTNALAAAVRLLQIVTSGDPLGRHHLKNHQVIDIAEDNQGLGVSVTEGKRAGNSMGRSGTPIAVAHYLIATGSSRDLIFLDRFIETLVEGAKKTDPIGMLRESMIKRSFDALARQGGAQNVYACAACILAWNDWLHGRRGSLSRLTWDSQSPFPKPE